MGDVTRILSAIEKGEPHAADDLLPLVYDELRKLASHRMSQEQPDQTLQATALVHEAYLRLSCGAEVAWENRAHFLGIAARAMRQVLVDHARARSAAKRGGGLRRVVQGRRQGRAQGRDRDEETRRHVASRCENWG